MSLSISEVKKIADLAKLNINDDEIATVKQSLEEILQLIDQMKQVDTAHVQPLAHPLDETQPLRIDQATEINQRDSFQKIAPNVYAGLYIVPKVIEAE